MSARILLALGLLATILTCGCSRPKEIVSEDAPKGAKTMGMQTTGATGGGAPTRAKTVAAPAAAPE